MFYYKHLKNIEGFKRILTDSELEDFFSTIENDMDMLFFKLQLLKGKRINELVKLNIRDIDFRSDLMYTYVSKKRGACSRRITYLDENTKNMIINYCRDHAVDIAYNHGFIFFKENCKRGHKSEDHFGARFSKYRASIGLNAHFYLDKKGKHRHFVRSHSLRATAINKILETTNGDIWKTLSFSHHKTVEGLIPYINEYNSRQLNAIEAEAFKKLSFTKAKLHTQTTLGQNFSDEKDSARRDLRPCNAANLIVDEPMTPIKS